MSFPRYPAYKDSGVEWLGEVPEHWEGLRLRFAATLNPSKQEARSCAEDDLVSFLPMEAIGEDGSLSLEQEKVVGECLNGYTYFKEGDVCIAKITPCFENGKGALLRGLKGGIGFGTTELIVARPRTEVMTAQFLDYLFRSSTFRSLGEAAMYGAGGQKRVPDSFVRDFVSFLPPVSEQSAIATFLDRETAKIDALIAEQQRLIELLQEKRQAVISHAVTKGLNPDAPMKDSGVEWLGEVPEHWEVKQLVRLVTLQRGHDITKDSQEEGPVPVLSSGGISSYHSQAICKGPAIVVGRKGTAGSLFFVEGSFWPHDTTLYSVDLHGNSAKYSFYYLHSIDLPSFDTGSSNPTLNRNRLHPFKVAAPSLEEQEEIVDYLDCKIEELDFICETVRAQIGLLGERRSALICAAVTGQIDVRGLVPEASAA
jgi:type I restriction enzyme S subunit